MRTGTVGLRPANTALRDANTVLNSQASVPVVSEFGPVIVRLLVCVSDQADALDLFVPVLGWHVNPNRGAMELF